MPVVSYASISDSPPLVAVACNPESFTCKLLTSARAFSLAIMSASFKNRIESLAKVSGRTTRDKLKAVGLAHEKGAKLAVPAIEGAEAILECRLQSAEKKGDHTLVIGLIEDARASGAFSDFWDFDVYKPILYTGWRGGLSTYPVN